MIKLFLGINFSVHTFCEWPSGTSFVFLYPFMFGDDNGDDDMTILIVAILVNLFENI